ncbi:MAG TPA: FAD-dependent oxidoreductase [Erysipelotrichaceae bacterium]|nr:FAD-dependent oxidoreductase [Erysipelotrichaceae bacterium]
MREISLLVIGGGAAGLAAAIEAKKNGIDDLLIVEKEGYLGGILHQCIHSGFGLTEFKEELTGPEYLERFVEQARDLNIPYKLNTQVVDISREKVVSLTNEEEGFMLLKAHAIIFATGCYERNAGSIRLPGDRPSGIMTAGTAQRYLNIHGLMVGKKIVILGSGDIGLIMARRLTLEGAKVICVSEIMPYSNGLNRNIVQCLDDYNIPLYLSRTVSKVVGKNRLEKVILSAVDKNLQIIKGTEMEIECDTLILSVGLSPYISLLNKINCPVSSARWVEVNQYMETRLSGIFICGNSLHVHDVVDFVSDEARLAGRSAALYLQGKIKQKSSFVNVEPGKGISYVLPQFIALDSLEDVTFKFRVRQPIKDQVLWVKSGEVILAKSFKSALIPSEMVMIKIPKDKLKDVKEEITLYLEDR